MTNTKLPTQCEECGKRTNKVNRSEDNPNVCRSCFEQATLEADHQDGKHDEEQNLLCPDCIRLREEGRIDRIKQFHRDGHHTELEDPNCPLCADKEPAPQVKHVVEDDFSAQDGDKALDHLATVHSTSRVKGCELCNMIARMDRGEVDPAWYEKPRGHANFDHSACDHPKTAKDRAQCRKNGAAAKFYANEA